MTHAQSALEAFTDKLHVTRWRGQIADAQCPAHDDSHASLVVSIGENGGVVTHCHAGCTTKAVLDAVGMTWKDLSPEPHVVATYNYLSEEGHLQYQVQRWEPKDFRSINMPVKGQRLLYHSEQLPHARGHGETIYVAEGEKDCDRLQQAGYVGVCGAGGAGSWLPQYSDQLAGLNVVVIADNDDPGRDHARAVVRSLDGVAGSVSLVQPSYGKDITDQLNAGYPLDTAVPLSMEEMLEVLRADMVQERPVSWLWPGYLPAGKLVMIEGDPGDGKSVMTCDLAARLTTGSPLPDGSRVPKTDVIMISAEDDPEDTIKPRLRVAGADLRRVHLVVGGPTENSAFDLARDLDALEALVTSTQAKVIFIDPLMAFMPAQINAYSDHEVRRALYPLSRMAQRNSTAIVVVRHLVKGSGRGKAITAGGGSIAFIGAARAGYVVAEHPEDETKRVFACVKINIGPKPAALGYKVVSSIHGDLTAPPICRWDSEPISLSAQDLLGGSEALEAKNATEDAKEWLIEYLCENHSGVGWQEITRAGKKDDHSEMSLRRARTEVAYSERNPQSPDGTIRKGTYWKIKQVGDRPSTQPPPQPEPERRLALISDQSQSDTGPDYFPDGPCDVCGGEPAVTFDEQSGTVRRCENHNPYTYGG